MKMEHCASLSRHLLFVFCERDGCTECITDREIPVGVLIVRA